MFCSNCGKEIDDKAVLCTHCGVWIGKIPEMNIIEKPKNSNGIAIAGFICSFLVPLLGWIFGGVGLARANKRNGKGKGFSIAAIVISTIMFFAYWATNY